MTFLNGKMPASTDVVELIPYVDPGGESWVVVKCLLCTKTLGNANYLNQAITLWTKHQAEERAHVRV